MDYKRVSESYKRTQELKNKDLNVGLNLTPHTKFAQITFKTSVFTFNREV